MSIRNRHTLLKGPQVTSKTRQMAIDLLDVALDAISPLRLVRKHLTVDKKVIRLGEHVLQLNEIDGIYVIGAGKATGRMAEAIETVLEGFIQDGFIIIPESMVNDFSLDFVKIHGGGHPVPTKSSLNATQGLLDFVSKIPSKALVISLISGGGSALLTLPTPPITLQELQQTTKLLLRSALPIDKINTIRKHLSQVKGGHLALLVHPRPHWSLLISDVPGDQLDMIASGPTLPDPTSFSDVVKIIDAYQLKSQIPVQVLKHVNAGLQGRKRDTPKPNDSIFVHVNHQLIGSNKDACQAALAYAQRKKYNARILTTDCQGEARDVGEKLGRLAQKLVAQSKSQVMIIGSETTVTLHHEGKGGRNTELIAAALPYLQGRKGLVIISVATDGIDGPTDAAGAIADGESYQRAKILNLSPKQLLETHSTYSLFQTLEDLIITGPTHTNVRDITIILWAGLAR